MTLSCGNEGCEDKRGLKESVFLVVSEFFQSILKEYHLGVTIFFEDESIVEDSHAFVDPESGEVEVVTSVVSGVGRHAVLDNLGEVTQVELVMELLGSGHELG